MSRNEWERGEINLPTTAAPVVRRAVVEAANAYHALLLADCLRIWNTVSAAPTGAAYVAALDHLFEAGRLPMIRGTAPSEHDHLGSLARVMYALAGSSRWQRKTAPHRPHAPRPIDVDPVALRVPARATKFSGSGWRIHFEDSTVSYEVADNNHAVSIARAHPVVAAFFAALSRVTWTRGSGGSIVGNDQNNQESDDAGGGANYLTASFGPRGEQAQADQMGVSLERYRSMRAGRPRR
jgi:hypothetical protein